MDRLHIFDKVDNWMVSTLAEAHKTPTTKLNVKWVALQIISYVQQNSYQYPIVLHTSEQCCKCRLHPRHPN